MEFKAILLGTSHPHIFHRYRYLKEKKNVELLGYYDSDVEVARRMQEHAGCPLFSDFSELLTLDFNVVFIHGRDHENAHYIRLAIDHGARGIFVEKPGVAQPKEFDALVNEIWERDIILEVGWELHYLETVEFARQIVRDAALGSITQARFHGGCPGGAGDEPWQSDLRNIGGFFYSLGGHVVESVIDFFGLPNQVVSSIRKLPEQKPHRGFSWVPGLFEERQLNPEKAIGKLVHEDIASAILEYENFNVHLDFTAWEPNGYLKDWTIDIYGVEGSLHLNLDGPGSHVVFKEPKDGWNSGKNELFSAPDNRLDAAFGKQLDSFFHEIVEGRMNEGCNERIAGKLLKLYGALYKSAETRRWIALG